MSTELAFWNEVFEQLKRTGPNAEDKPADERWLVPFVPLLRAQGVQRILEVGCGAGRDTEFLMGEGFHVVATDFSPNALALVRERLPDVQLLLHNTRDPFPFTDGSFDFVLASLSLHYFDDAATRKIVAELSRLLRPRGLLLYRMNSTEDMHFGAGQGDLLEENFFLHDGIRRRYFTPESCRSLFRDWEELLLEKKTVDRYSKRKVLLEGLVRKP